MRFPSTRLALAPALAACSVLALGACLAIAPHGIQRETDEPDASDDSPVFADAPPPENPPPEAGTPDPHAVLGAEPSHGPFAGGQRVLIRGKGFTSKARVWFGDVEVDPTTVVAVDPSRVQVSAPPGVAGPVDVTVQNGDDASTGRKLAGGYHYDALYAVPDTGPVPGGTVIEILGQGTAWDATTVVKIDQKPCTTLVVDGPTTLHCTVPAGTPGAKPVAVTTGSESIVVLDAYTYQDSDNGFKGGLSGAPLNGELKVLVFDNYSGQAISGAHVIVGTDMATALVGDADFTGVAVFQDASLVTPQTVTVAAKCHSPITFVAEPVDTVTAYLDPVLSPSCASSGDPPPVGGKPVYAGAVAGELVWDPTGEFKKGNWYNVPPPIGPNERQAAYVFAASGDPSSPFTLPAAEAAVLPTSPGDRGYQFGINLLAGNRSLYALAGIEDRSVNPPKFTAYAMGSVKGVPVVPAATTDSVFIAMSKTLDQALVMDVVSPAPGPKGPDRLRANVAITLGNDGYAIFPAGQKSPYLPIQGLLSFVGLPALDGDLAGSAYVSSAKAVTGQLNLAPMSVIGRFLTTTTAQTVTVDGFVQVPTLVTPAANAAWDGTHLAATFPPGGAPVDLVVYDVQSGNGLVHWLVASPAPVAPVTLPALSGYPDSALPPGPIVVAVYGARIDGFDYTKLLYRQLRPIGMSAYSLDLFNSHL